MLNTQFTLYLLSFSKYPDFTVAITLITVLVDETAKLARYIIGLRIIEHSETH